MQASRGRSPGIARQRIKKHKKARPHKRCRAFPVVTVLYSLRKTISCAGGCGEHPAACQERLNASMVVFSRMAPILIKSSVESDSMLSSTQSVHTPTIPAV